MPRFTRFLAVSAAITLAVLCLAIPAFSQKTYVAGFATNKVYYFNPIMGSQTVIDLPGNPFDVVITTDGLTAYVSCLYGNTVAVIDVTTNNISATIETPLTPSRLAIGNSESRLYVANQSLTAPHLTVVDITKRKGARLNKVVAQLDLNAYVPGADTAYAVATYHNAVAKKDLMAVGTISGHVLLFDTTNKGITYKGHWYVGIGVSDLVFSKDGTKLYFVLLGGGIDGNLLVADVASFTVSKGLVLGDSSNPLGSGVLNGKTLYVTGPADSKFYKINTATDTLAGTVPLPAGSTPFDIAAFNLGAAQGGLTLFMTDTAHSQLDTFSKKTLGVITLEPGATPYGIAVTTKNWQPKIGYTITDLGTLGGDSSKAMAVNASGQVAGHSTLAGNSIVHAFLYSSGVMQDLGALSGTNSFAWGINTSGQVVGMWQLPGFNGYHSFLYSGGVMQDLGTLGGTSSWANGINDSGQIVGVFFDGEIGRAHV
jgi:probable HAF family extracellular repeat protein/YVTN family beta-propeller protein